VGETRIPKFRNERTRVTWILRHIKARLTAAVEPWANGGGQVYIPLDERGPGDPYLRDREWHEDPQHQPAAWRTLAKEARRLAGLLVKLAEYAEHQERETAEQVKAMTEERAA
jgi:DNA mismatch repair protein MutH